MKQTKRARAAQQQELRQSLLLRAVTAFLVLAAAILFVFLLLNFESVSGLFSSIMTAIGPVLTGLLFAYLLNPICVFFEKHLRKLTRRCKNQQRAASTVRGISALLTVLLAVAAITSLCILVVPAVVQSITSIAADLPEQIRNFTERGARFLESDSRLGKLAGQAMEYVSEPLEKWANDGMVAQANVWVGYLATGILGAFSFAYNLIIGLFIAVYLLIGKERFLRQGSKLLYAVTKPHRADWIRRRLESANDTFSNAILGKMLDSLIIGMLCFTGSVILKTPYPALIAVIVGVTNMIPFFGPFIGAVPSALLVLMNSPQRALYFCIFILLLQQFDCNILDPKIVGGSIGLPAFWSLFACLLGGGLFGIIGMLIGVPAFAVFYKLAKELIEERLRRRDLSAEQLAMLGISPNLDPNDTFYDSDEDEEAEEEPEPKKAT